MTTFERRWTRHLFPGRSRFPLPSRKQSQLKRLREFQHGNQAETPAMLERLRQAVIKDENVFEVLMDAVRVCSLGQITHALFEVGGQYRRSM